ATVAPMDRRLGRSLFCNDLDEAGAAFVLDRLCHEPLAIFMEPVSRRGLAAGLPVTYVTLRRDRALVPARQRAAAARLPGAVLVELDAGHDVMVGRPDALAAVLQRVADSVALEA